MMKLMPLFLYAILITLITACTSNSTDDDTSTITLSPNTPTITSPLHTSTTNLNVDTTKINALFEQGDFTSPLAINRGNIVFAIDLFKEIQTPTENVIYSPYSISNAFGMLYGGSKGATEEQIQNVLHFPEKNTLAFHQAFEQLNTQILTHPDETITLRVANKIWMKDGFKVKDGFTEMTKAFYKTDLGYFSNGTDGSRKINTWVSQQTNNKIPKIISASDLERVKMVLANAIYFYGNWENEFDSTETAPDTFFTDKKPIVTDFMYGSMSISLQDFMNADVLQLDYKDRKASMLIVLPNEDIPLQNIIKDLSVETYLEWCNRSITKVNLSLPKWKSAPPAIPLSKKLINLGLSNPFDKDADVPNFDNMAKNLYVSSVLHKAMIEVTEKGAEAAATTTVTMKGRGAAQPFPFIVNRPFLYIIKDNDTQSILFMGQVIDPSISE